MKVAVVVITMVVVGMVMVPIHGMAPGMARGACTGVCMWAMFAAGMYWNSRT